MNIPNIDPQSSRCSTIFVYNLKSDASDDAIMQKYQLNQLIIATFTDQQSVYSHLLSSVDLSMSFCSTPKKK